MALDNNLKPVAAGGTRTYANPDALGQAAPTTSGLSTAATDARTAPALTSAQTSAKAQLASDLDSMGLGALGDFAWNEYLNGVPETQILLDIRNTDTYKQIYPGLSTLQGQHTGWTEASYNSAVQTFMDASHAYGVTGYTRTDFGNLLAAGVSTSEWTNRVQLASQAATQTDATDRAQLQRLYGITDGDLTSYWLDPTKALPDLQVKFTAAQDAAASSRTGFGDVDQATAEQLAQSGVSASQATQGFAQLAAQAPALAALPGQDPSGISTADQVNAQFNGDAAAQAKITAAKAAKTAVFGGSSQVATTAQGVASFAPQR